MSVDTRNSEGYMDLTAYEAMSAIEREERHALRAFRPIVYVCSPYAGDAPHLLFPQFLRDDDPTERELGLFFGNALMSKCSEVWVFGSTISPGMAAEIKRARWKNYRLRYFTEEMEEITNAQTETNTDRV